MANMQRRHIHRDISTKKAHQQRCHIPIDNTSARLKLKDIVSATSHRKDGTSAKTKKKKNSILKLPTKE
jgi:hypothetical protein